jgi:hypothetical protein
MPPASSIEREEEHRLNMRTLVIASVASAAAAAVTSQLWIHGTWLAAALTPALVALISEAMHRPTERLARARTSDRPALGAGAPRRTRSRPQPAPFRAAGAAGPVRVYRQPSPRAPRRRIALGVVAATAGVGLVIAVAALTAGDLISGDSIGKGGGPSTFFDPTSKQQPDHKNTTPQPTTPDQPATTEQPTPTEEQPPSDTAPAAPPPEASPGETAPDAAPSP